MSKRNYIFCLFCLICVPISCGGPVSTKATVLEDAENDISEAMQAYSEADWRRAQRLFSRALSIYRGIDDQQGMLQSHINLSEVALSVHDYQASQRHLDKAAEIIRHNSLDHYQRRITLLYAQQALQLQRISQAETLLQALLPAFTDAIPNSIPDAIQMAAIANRTKIAFIRGQDQAQWIQRYAAALQLSASGDGALQARLLRFQAGLLQSQGNDGVAEAKLRQALSIYKEHLCRPGIAVTLSELGLVAMRQEQWQLARDYFKRSIAVYRYLRDMVKIAQLTEKLVKVEVELSQQVR